MSQRLIPDSAPWTAEDDAILIACWLDPKIDCVAIAKMMPDLRTVEAVQHRSQILGLGQKARHKKGRRQKKNSMAWPNDMPDFEDHPLASPSGSRARAALLGSRFKLFSHSSDTSLTGSSLEGASAHGLLSDE